MHPDAAEVVVDVAGDVARRVGQGEEVSGGVVGVGRFLVDGVGFQNQTAEANTL